MYKIPCVYKDMAAATHIQPSTFLRSIARTNPFVLNEKQILIPPAMKKPIDEK